MPYIPPPSLPLTGGTLTGLLNFSGTTHAGIQLNNLTTTQQNAVVGAAGDFIWNTTLVAPSVYDGAAWQAVGLLNTVQTWTQQNTFAAGTITTSQPLTITQTFNGGAGVTHKAFFINVVDTSSAAASSLIDAQISSVSKFTVTKAGAVTAATSFATAAGGFFSTPGGGYFQAQSNTGRIYFGLSSDAVLGYGGASTIRLGEADAATAVAQTLRVQGIVAGTADIAGANWTLAGSRSTGAGVPGDIVFQTAGKGAASTVQNTLITAFTIKGGTTNNTNVGYPSVIVGNAALATTATDGFLHIPTCAGTPTGVPNLVTGIVPMVFDTTNSQFWFYTGGAWKQPKTPAGAAIVTWQ